MKYLFHRAHGGSLLMAAALLISMIALAQYGPFLHPWAQVRAGTVGALYLPGDRLLATLAGSFDAARAEFRTADSAGVLLYGPYASLDAGRYAVAWRGSAFKDSRPRFEITSSKGLIATRTANLAAGTTGATLATIEFGLAAPAERVEFRMLVERDDAVAVHAVEVTALATAAAGARD